MKLLRKGKPVEISDDHAENVLRQYPHIYSKIGDEPEAIPENEVIATSDKPCLTHREDLEKLPIEELFNICSEIGLNVKSHYKKETLISKILEVSAEAEEFTEYAKGNN